MSSYGQTKKAKPSYYKPATKYSGKVVKKNITMQPKKKMVEQKNFDTTVASVTLPASSAWSTPQQLNLIVQGTTASNRIGREITNKSIYLRYTSTAATANVIPLRCIVVFDKAPGAALPAITDIVVTDTFNAPHNLDNKERFVTLIDVVLQPQGNPGHMVEYRKIDLPTVYRASAGAYADLATGGFIIMFCGLGLAAPSTCGYYNRIKFTDC